VGSSEDNTVMELILGHNGLNRLFGGGGGSPQTSPDDGDDGAGDLVSGIRNPLSNQPPIPANPPPQSGGNALPADAQFDGPTANGHQPANRPDDGGLGSDEIGQPGLLRLFVEPLSNEIAWLLPLALASLIIVAVSRPIRWPLGLVHKGWLLWGGWFLTAVVFFSLAEFYHAYYLTMLAAPLAALVGAGLASLGRWIRDGSAVAGLVLALLVVICVLYQGYVGSAYTDHLAWFLPSLGIMVLAMGGLAAILILRQTRWTKLVLSLALAAVLAAPGMWSLMTALDGSPNVNLPQAYEYRGDQDGNRRMAVDEKLLDFLLANTTDDQYLMAVRSSMEGAAYVLETGRPVLYMGGFNGGDPVVSTHDLELMVAQGDMRYVLWTPSGRPGATSNAIAGWLVESCQTVQGLGLAAGGAARPGPDGDGPPAAGSSRVGVVLYDCGEGL
jgi:4-amino-4-deoxy-L-arabinose transferase-like glycosyltransferase